MEGSMDSRKIVFRETAVVAVGELICCGIMIGVFALAVWHIFKGLIHKDIVNTNRDL
jgi:hypothetical protein